MTWCDTVMYDRSEYSPDSVESDPKLWMEVNGAIEAEIALKSVGKDFEENRYRRRYRQNRKAAISRRPEQILKFRN